MANKNDILDYSTTPSENQDIGGISIQGTAKPSNLDDAERMMMSHIAKAVTRRVAKDTAYTVVKADYNQLIAFTEAATCTTQSAATLTSGWECYIYAEGGAVTINPNGSETVNGEEFIVLSEGTLGVLRVYNGNFLFSSYSGSGALPKITIYNTAGAHTHNFQSGTSKFQLEGCGAGGAGQGALSSIGLSGETMYGSGGHSGWFFETDVLDRNAITSASIVIGAAGTSTAGSNTKTNGGNSTYDDGVNSFTWDGGLSPAALTTGDLGGQILLYNQPSTPSVAKANYGVAGFGTRGLARNGSISGKGGDSPYGRGGPGVENSNNPGTAGAGNGSGGSGAAKNGNSNTNAYNGGAGTPGIIIVKEWS